MDTSSKINKISVLLCNGNEPLPKQGGMERVTDALARGLISKGIKVAILCRNRNRLGEHYESPCPIYYLPNINNQVFFENIIKDKKITHIIDQGEDDIIGKFGIYKKRPTLLKNIQLIAVQHNSPGAVMKNYKLVMFRPFSVPLFEFVYNNWLLPIRKIHSLTVLKKRYHNIFNNYDSLVTLSPAFINDIRIYQSLESKCKFFSIPNMNTYCKIGHCNKKNHVLFVGRLINNIKGTDKLIRIWSKINKDICNDWILDIVGDGPDRDILEKQVKELGLTNVIFHGFKDPRSFYENSKIFCLTSITEGFGMVLTEAMQHGVVPFAFESYAAINDIITHSQDGFLIHPFNETEYANKLSEIMKNEHLLSIMSNNAKKNVEKFSEKNIINQWIRLMTEK